MKTAYHPVLYKSKVKALGLIGYGHIAQKVAKIEHTFSMKIIFYNHRLKKVPESWIQQVSFDELLRQSDVLSLHVIQTPETIDLINNDTIAEMKNGVIILNTARGKLVNEADIRNALNEGKIYAYATDVVKGEPIASDSPLLQAKNCYITPHITWAPYETRDRLLHMTVDNIKAYLSGDLKNVIN